MCSVYPMFVFGLSFSCAPELFLSIVCVSLPRKYKSWRPHSTQSVAKLKEKIVLYSLDLTEVDFKHKISVKILEISKSCRKIQRY